MSYEISSTVTMCQKDILETLVSFARNKNAIAYQNLYRQYFKDASVGEMHRTFNLIILAFELANKE